ncbi:B12-binding domain-containing protein [Micromonospora tulbaghiae]|uniref:cobalamin B12-binding domain-containing protein n=1 Tax=Micromonospora tulbaghiae TaxID=479978 RepID=UPI0036B10861
MTPERRIGPEALAAYLDHLDAADRAGAVALARGVLADGFSVADVLVDLVAVAQREVGRRWLTGSWSVAQEHAATHVSEQVVDALGATIGPPRRGHAVMACVEGEWHALAARIVTEVVRAAGWRVTFLGASVPARHLVSYLHQTGPDAVLLSCVQPNRLVRAARMVEASRAAGVPVLAGGPGFGPDGRWAAAIGAAGWGAGAGTRSRCWNGRCRPRTPARRRPRPTSRTWRCCTGGVSWSGSRSPRWTRRRRAPRTSPPASRTWWTR